MTNATIPDGTRPLLRRTLCAGAVILALFTLTGCATNLTGFEFPRFGLTSEPKQPDAEISNPGASSSQSLSAANNL